MKNEYDIIIVGAGPAGSTVARYAAEAGLSVLMLEKDRDVGYPVRCGEAVSHEGVSQFIEPDPRWIAATITKFKIIAPNGSFLLPKIDGKGYVLERRIFDYELAKIATEKGAQIITKAYVYDLLRENEKVVGVRVLIKDKKIDIRGKIIIGADGVESRIGKWAGIDTTCHIRDMESCAQMTISGIDVDTNTLEFYIGDHIAPEGYLWVFPKGKNIANIGLGIAVEAAKEKSAIHYLKEFVDSHYPNAAVLTHIAGGVPCAKTLDTMVKGNVILVGDAAHQVNPLSGGGIITGMIGGMMAAQVAVEALLKNNLSHLHEYEKRWHKRLGWRHEAFYNVKDAYSHLRDETINTICDKVSSYPVEKQTFGLIFRTAMWNQPSLLLDIAKIFIS